MGILFAKETKGAAPSRATPSDDGAAPPPEAGAVSNADAEAALDTLGAVLRALGANAFDVGELDAPGVRRLFERWSQHALVAAPLDAEAPPEGGARRDWTLLRQLVSSHRKRETEYVVTSLSDLREAIWSFVEIVNRATVQDKHDGVLAQERLARLRSALQSKDTATLRNQVTETANALESAFAEQQKQQQQRIAEFASSVRSLGEQLESAKRESALDPLTRLPNRASFDEFLARTIKLASLVGGSFSLMMIDVDQFKTINDTLGHQAGDATIKAIADCLVRRFPRRGDLVARYGGDEFAVVLRDAARVDACSLAQRLTESVRATKIVHNGREIRVSSSLGFATFEPGDTSESWLSRADAALYRAKAAGRDRWVEWTPTDPPQASKPNAPALVPQPTRPAATATATTTSTATPPIAVTAVTPAARSAGTPANAIPSAKDSAAAKQAPARAAGSPAAARPAPGNQGPATATKQQPPVAKQPVIARPPPAPASGPAPAARPAPAHRSSTPADPRQGQGDAAAAVPTRGRTR